MEKTGVKARPHLPFKDGFISCLEDMNIVAAGHQSTKVKYLETLWGFYIKKTKQKKKNLTYLMHGEFIYFFFLKDISISFFSCMINIHKLLHYI